MTFWQRVANFFFQSTTLALIALIALALLVDPDEESEDE